MKDFTSYGLAIGMLLFIAQTGANLDTAQQLQLVSMKVLPSTQGRRFGNKSRAGGKTVRPEFGVNFEPIFRKILELRAWYIQDEQCDLVFPMRDNIRKLSSIGNSKLQSLKNFCSAFSRKWLGSHHESGASMLAVNMLN